MLFNHRTAISLPMVGKPVSIGSVEARFTGTKAIGAFNRMGLSDTISIQQELMNALDKRLTKVTQPKWFS